VLKSINQRLNAQKAVKAAAAAAAGGGAENVDAAQAMVQ
jgi:hypothetical protein